MVKFDKKNKSVYRDNLPPLTLPECQTVLIQIRTDILSDQGPNCLQRSLADDKSHQQQDKS